MNVSGNLQKSNNIFNKDFYTLKTFILQFRTNYFHYKIYIYKCFQRCKFKEKFLNERVNTYFNHDETLPNYHILITIKTYSILQHKIELTLCYYVMYIHTNIYQ